MRFLVAAIIAFALAQTTQANDLKDEKCNTVSKFVSRVDWDMGTFKFAPEIVPIDMIEPALARLDATKMAAIRAASPQSFRGAIKELAIAGREYMATFRPAAGETRIVYSARRSASLSRASIALDRAKIEMTLACGQ